MKKYIPLKVVLRSVGEPTLDDYGASRSILDSPERIFQFWASVIETKPDFEADKETVIVILLDAKLRPRAYLIRHFFHSAMRGLSESGYIMRPAERVHPRFSERRRNAALKWPRRSGTVEPRIPWHQGSFMVTWPSQENQRNATNCRHQES